MQSIQRKPKRVHPSLASSRLQQTKITILLLGGILSGCASQNKLAIAPDLSTNPPPNAYLDLNKHGRLDPYENPTLSIERRIDNLLSQMTVEEKTCQLATLYGYGRVLKDPLPTSEWKSEIWKDGIANIDEQLNGWPPKRVNGQPVPANPNIWPPSAHARAINQIQHWFIAETRLGIPVDFTNEGIRGVNHYAATCFPSQNGMGCTWDRELLREQGEIVGAEARALGYTNIYAPIMDVSRDQRWGRNEDTFGESSYLTAELAIPMIESMQANGVASTLKHFALYSIPKGGREGLARTDPQIGPREADEELLYPFARAFREAHPWGVMSSYNDYDGVPISGSDYWLIDILRHEYGFNGYVVSDSDAVEYLFNKHHTAGTYKEAVRQAVMAGLNVRTTFNPPQRFIQPLRELVHEGAVPMKVLDARVRDVLRVKFSLGLFDHPYVDPQHADDVVMSQKNMDVALRASRESLVLLKNETNLLPLKKSLKKILVCGPNASDPWYAQSRYGPSSEPVTTVLEGIRNKFKTPPTTVAATPASPSLIGDPASPSLPSENAATQASQLQNEQTTEVVYAKGCNSVDPGWPQTEVLPEPMTETEKQGIDEAVAAAKGADVAIVVLGDGRHTTGEDQSRTSLDLPGRQLDLIQAISATGTPVILVLINGRSMSINWPAKNIPAILCANFPGAQGGTAIADVLFGDYNPSGKLTTTWPKTVGQIPMNFPTKPNAQWESPKAANVAGALYPFGHGLSYTTFDYSNLKIKPAKDDKFTTTGDVIVNVDIKNTGKLDGDEIVQLYTRDLVSSVTTYEKQLSGFQRVPLHSGETKTVEFLIKNERLSLINRNWKRVVEPGEFKVMVGASSEDIRLEGLFTVK
jgi:beta-glucosidase